MSWDTGPWGEFPWGGVAVAPDLGVGWIAKAVSPADLTTVLAEVIRFDSLQMQDQISDLGGGAIVIDSGDSIWDDENGKLILSREVLWRIFQDGDFRFEFFAEDVKEDVVTSGEETSKLRMFSGRGPGVVMGRAIVLPEGWGQSGGGDGGGSNVNVSKGLLPMLRGHSGHFAGPQGDVVPGGLTLSSLTGGINSAHVETEQVEQAGYGQRVWDIAHAQLGKPYVFGAAGPNAYDCSGLTKYCWYHGTDGRVNLLHRAYLQYNSVKHVSGGFAAAQKGDLVWFNFGNLCPPSCPGHVAICEGDGVHIISATNPSTGVQYRTIGTWLDNVMAIGRPLSSPPPPPPPPPPGGGGGDGNPGGGSPTNRGLLSLMRGHTTESDSLDKQSTRTFNGHVIASWITLFDEAVARGTIPFMNLNFDKDKDSAGIPWDDDQVLEVQIGTNLLGLWIQICSDNVFEWHMDPGFLLSIYKTSVVDEQAGTTTSARGLLTSLRGFSHRSQWYRDDYEYGHHRQDLGMGVHREGQVIFNIGRHQTSHLRERTRRDLHNFLMVLADDNTIYFNEDINSEGFWGKREFLLDPTQIRDGTSLQKFIDSSLRTFAEETDSRIVQVVPEAAGRALFTDYGLGDYLGIETDRGVEVERLMAYAITVDGNAQYDLEITLGSVIPSWQEKLIKSTRGEVKK